MVKRRTLPDLQTHDEVLYDCNDACFLTKG
jgi:hypothetical protein